MAKRQWVWHPIATGLPEGTFTVRSAMEGKVPSPLCGRVFRFQSDSAHVFPRVSVSAVPDGDFFVWWRFSTDIRINDWHIFGQSLEDKEL